MDDKWINDVAVAAAAATAALLLWKPQKEH